MISLEFSADVDFGIHLIDGVIGRRRIRRGDIPRLVAAVALGFRHRSFFQYRDAVIGAGGIAFSCRFSRAYHRGYRYVTTRIIGFLGGGGGRRRRRFRSGFFCQPQFVLHPTYDAAVSTICFVFRDFRLDVLQPTVDTVFHRSCGFLDPGRDFFGRMSDGRHDQHGYGQ